ncbi:MAG: hypothetical protein F6K54_05545 [Okeania sp. SIO3B5]|uniref:helix-turn-helix transcriptional regulator n=1 Tax=Okeania sp. SIO3B5 TaxID=2607811 RepID=UPI0014006D4D|nr:helix-turn-helix transcriptional regulator [Okeania sp. SIO3B5]NEO52583.1 hypothetical protein [Okeania sp. SIO3B5]
MIEHNPKQFVDLSPEEQQMLLLVSFSDKGGLEVIEHITKQSNGEICFKLQSLFLTLNKLEDIGLVESHSREELLVGDNKIKLKCYYKITKDGKCFI